MSVVLTSGMTRTVTKTSRRVKRSARAVLREVVRFLQFYAEVLSVAFLFAKEKLYATTLPVTKRLLSRKPHPPRVRVNDIRANRIKLELKPCLSSPFNVETYEISFTPKGTADVEEDWKTVGCNDMTWRTVARLKGDHTYRFRVRTYNNKGISSWSEVLEATTKLEPVEGGAYGPGYRWTQTESEVCLSIEVPNGTQKKAVSISLDSQYLRVELLRPGSCKETVLLEGALPHRVRSWANGSYWELLKENGKSVLSVTLEKEHRAVSVKFDFWRSFFVGHPEIDTHKIPVDDSMRGNQLIQPGSIPASHLAAYGLNRA